MYEEMEPKDIKETGTETEEPRQTVRDYYADGTPVTRREEPKEPPRAQDPERPNYEPYRFGEPERQSRQSYRYSQPPQGGKRKNGKRAAAIVAALAAFSLFVGLLIAGISHLGDYIRTRIVIDEPTQSASAPEIAEEKERTAEIDSLKTYMKTDAYAEEVAREKLGLVKPDEIVFEEEKTMND